MAGQSCLWKGEALPSGVGETQPSQFSLAWLSSWNPPWRQATTSLRYFHSYWQWLSSHSTLCVQDLPLCSINYPFCVPTLPPSPDLIQSGRKTTAPPDDQMVTRGGQDPHYPFHLQLPPGSLTQDCLYVENVRCPQSANGLDRLKCTLNPNTQTGYYSRKEYFF